VTDSPNGDDPRLLALARSIAEGETVDWADVAPIADPETAAALEQLRALEPLIRWGDPIPDRWGPFPITGELGRGSFGTVYRAHDPTLDIEVALKVIRPGAADRAGVLARGMKEARMLAQVTHPHVVRIYRVDQVGDDIGVAMELVRGRTLHDLVKKHGRFDANDAARIGVEIGQALTAVHEAGLVHADVKAQNVMHAAGRGSILMDLGAGADLKRDESRPGSGTPLYMAPEVIAGNPPTPVSDVYSLGVLLYFLVTGSYPVEGDNRAEVERAHQRRGSRRSLAEVRSDLPGQFVRIVERATSERVRDRYPSARALETALKRGLDRNWRPGWKPWPIAALLTLSVGGWITYNALQAPSPGGADVTSIAPAPARTAPITAPGSYRIEAALYRRDNGKDVKLTSGARLGPADLLSMQVRSSVPTYVYVVNEDDLGESWLLFPIPGLSLSNPLPAGQRLRLPGVPGQDLHWEVTSAGGREHFVVYAMTEPPSPALKRFFDSLPPPSLDRPVLALPLSPEGVTLLRGVGGLKPAPAARADGAPRVSDESYASLSGEEEEARGLWVRQLSFENRGK
jgi:serine/threonine protein kinase